VSERGTVIGKRTVLSLEIIIPIRPAITVVNWALFRLTAGSQIIGKGKRKRRKLL